MNLTIAPTDSFNCPHCDEKQEGAIKDYVIPGRTGFASMSEEICSECGESFEVSLEEDGTFTVEPVFQEEE